MAECCQSDVFQGDLARLCREDSVLMRGKELLEVPLKSAVCSFALPDVAQAECLVDGVEHALFVAAP